MIELKHHIKTHLERGCGWDIDNKTVRRLAGMLKEQGLINVYEFEVKYLANRDSEEEEEEAEGEGDEFTLRKVRRCEVRSKTEGESKHLKIILTTPDVDEQDERIWNDPSITNPSLRQDKELPNSILKRVIENK
mmetsp:Transcript_19078/g.21969  ORF Transcript_19078/g.21969 Transcript_19078/m.21969 type:complete len:134 (-) Transcript_19078:1013-1414(-)